jgi:hypothetical protein
VLGGTAGLAVLLKTSGRRFFKRSSQPAQEAPSVAAEQSSES